MARHAERTGELRNTYGVLKRAVEDNSLGGKRVDVVGVDRKATFVGCCHGHDPSLFLKGEEFLVYLFVKDCAP